MIGLSLALALMAAGDAPTPPQEILRPVWLAQPSEADYAQAYPQGLNQRAAAGLLCRAARDGSLADCRVQHSYPKDSGVDAAALSLVPRYRIAPLELGGRATEGREVKVSVLWMYVTGEASSSGAARLYAPPPARPGPDQKVSILTRPNWAAPPDPTVFERFYPEHAFVEGRGGKVVLDCLISTEGRVFECVVASEEPAGYGFGEASLSAAPTFRMKPATRDGQPYVTSSRIPLMWTPPPPLPAPETRAK